MWARYGADKIRGRVGEWRRVRKGSGVEEESGRKEERGRGGKTRKTK